MRAVAVACCALYLGTALAQVPGRLVLLDTSSGAPCELAKAAGRAEIATTCDVATQTASIEGNARAIAELRVALSAMNATLNSQVAKTDALYDVVHHATTGLANAHAEIDLNDQDISGAVDTTFEGVPVVESYGDEYVRYCEDFMRFADNSSAGKNCWLQITSTWYMCSRPDM